MKRRRALLLSLFTLFLVFPAANTGGLKDAENLDSATGDLLADLTEGEINFNNGREYRDGMVDNFDSFLNPGYSTGFIYASVNI